MANTALRGPVTGRGYLLATIGYLSLFLSLWMVTERKRRALGLAILLVAIGVLQSFLGLYQMLGGPADDNSSGQISPGVTGTFINHNHFAGLINLVMPLTIGLFTWACAKNRRVLSRTELYALIWLILLSSAWMGVAVFLSLSRAGVATLVASLITMGLMLFFKKGQSQKTLRFSLVTLLLLILGLSIAIGLDGLIARYENLEAGWQERRTVYQDSLALIWDSPLLGVGPGMFEWKFRLYQSLDPSVWWKYAHNDYIQSAADWGIPLALLFWGFVAWCLCRCIKAFSQTNDAWHQAILLGCSGSILGLLLHSCFDFNLQIPSNRMVFFVVLAISWASTEAVRLSTQSAHKGVSQPSAAREPWPS